MPNDEVKISQLPVGTLGNGSLFETSEVSGESYASTKVAASDLGNYINTVLQYAGLKTAVLNVVGAVNSVLAIFADEYNTTTYYNPGWYCIKDGMLYVCQNDTHGTWSDGAWTETTVDEALRSMKGEIEYFDLIKFNSDNVAAFHNTTTAYSKGDYCINDEDLVLYRAKVDIPTGEAWDSTKWEAVTIGSELKSLNDSRLDDLPVVTMPYSSVATFNTDRAVPVDVTCEIGSTGASAVNITQTGKNIYPIKVGRDNWTNNRNATHTDNADILSITTASETNSGVYARTTSQSTLLDTIIAHNVNVTISLYAKASAANSDFFFGFQTIGGTTATLTTDWQKVIIPIYNYYGLTPIMTFYNRSGASITVDVKDVQIEIGEATDYEAYKTNTRTISIGETVYEGSVNITEGGSVTYDDGHGSTSTLSPITPITPYIGTNNIWADTGDTSVAYRESAQRYVDENTGLSRAKVYSLNLSQGGAWINTGVDVTNVDTLMFERNDNSDVNLQVVIKKSQIAVYTGGADVYTMIYNQGGKPLNVRIYNNVLYASYNGTGAATYVTNVYALKDVF